ncbi:MAG: hypothetical protein AAGI11_05815 [Pseudomonadota bacterium]
MRRTSPKSALQKIAAPLLFEDKVVIASNGRSGSTLLQEAIAAGLIASRYPRLRGTPLAEPMQLLAMSFTQDLSEVRSKPVPVQKTHDFFAPAYGNDARYLFVYGDPLDAALSVRRMFQTEGAGWFRQHMANMHSEASIEELLLSDALYYERQLISWGGAPRDRVLLLRYEQLWDRIDQVVDYLGFSIELPAYRDRERQPAPVGADMAVFERLRGIMQDLDRKAGT